MNIETVLNLKVDMIYGRDVAALEILAEAWETQGRPTEAQKLIAVLKTTLDRCELRGISYPRILLKRKGELTRGEFQPRTDAVIVGVSTIPEVDRCPQCRGMGFSITPAGKADLCRPCLGRGRNTASAR
jgi:hypothetical protein